MKPAWLLFFPAAALCAGCAIFSKSRTVDMEPLVISAQPDPELGLDMWDATTLFEEGKKHFKERNFAKAAKFFEKLVSDFPESKYLSNALFNAGLCHELLGDCRAALEKYQYIVEELKNSEDVTDALIRAGDCHMQTGDLEAAIGANTRAVEREDIDDIDRIEVYTKIGVAYFDRKDHFMAEDALLRATYLYRKVSKEERIEDLFYPSQAHFYLARIAHAKFSEALLIVPEQDEEFEKAAQALERKCRLLLDAQSKYITTIRIGNSHWATAAGLKIGSLYEDLYETLVKLPVPSDLDEEQAAVYREELKKKVEVLVTKAIDTYQRSLEMADRVGAKNEWVKQTQKSLERLKALYLKDYSS